jgi:transposase
VCDRDMVDVVFPHLDAVLVEQVEREGGTVRVVARSHGEPVPCPCCSTLTGKVHGYYRRRVADSPAGGAPVVLELVLRRLVCTNRDCARQTFHEQVPGLAERYARRTPPLAGLVAAVAVALAGRVGSALLAAAGVLLSPTAVLGALMALPEPAGSAPEAIGVDDFALRRGQRYATVIVDAVTRERLDVLDGRLAVTLEAWLKGHPRVKLVRRDRSTAYAAGARDAADPCSLPDVTEHPPNIRGVQFGPDAGGEHKAVSFPQVPGVASLFLLRNPSGAPGPAPVRFERVRYW